MFFQALTPHFGCIILNRLGVIRRSQLRRRLVASVILKTNLCGFGFLYNPCYTVRQQNIQAYDFSPSRLDKTQSEVPAAERKISRSNNNGGKSYDVSENVSHSV